MNTNELFSNFRLNVYTGGYLRLYPTWGNANRANPHSKLYFITSGKLELIVGNSVYTGGRGKMFLIPAGIKHTFRTFKNDLAEKYWLHFNIDANGYNIFDFIKLPYCIDVAKNDMPLISNKFANILAFTNNITRSAVDYFSVRANILEILAYYCETSNALPPHVLKKDPLSDVIVFINENLDTDFTVESLSGIAHMHPNYFSHYFKKRMNTSPIKYINNLRIEKAKFLIETSSLSFSQIGNEVGFSDIKYFSRIFKKATKHTLSNYRKSNNNNPSI